MRRLPIIFTTVFCLLFGSFAQAKKERFVNDTSNCTPALPIEQALKIAKNKLSKNSNPDDFFIDSVLLQCQQSEAVWEVGWRRKAYQSGHLLMYIHENSSVQERVVKDG